MANDNVAPSRGPRPLSIWFLCICNGLIAIVMIATGFLAGTRGYSQTLAALYGLTGLAISIAAHATWYGSRIGRSVLLVLLTVYLGNLIGYSGWTMATSEAYFDDEIVTTGLLRIGLSLVWLSLNYIFLFGKRARVFFA
jgi:hypothetical protein